METILSLLTNMLNLKARLLELLESFIKAKIIYDVTRTTSFQEEWVFFSKHVT